ncbi:hypothetical protein ACE1CB_37630 [Aerosakkonema sp. BLCC-F2]
MAIAELVFSEDLQQVVIYRKTEAQVLLKLGLVKIKQLIPNWEERKHDR